MGGLRGAKVFRKFEMDRVLFRAVLVPAALVAALATWLIAEYLLDIRAGRQIERVPMNASLRDVELVMGQPDSISACRGSELASGCASEAHYEHFLSTWVIRYSADGHVVWKGRYVSD